MASSEFIWRRIHSLMGLWLVLYLLEHFLVNSQAPLWGGAGFVRMVNSIQDLPFLPVIEIVLLGVPFAIHIAWGLQRLFSSKSNATKLPFERNIAYTLQRLSSWILLFGLIGHVAQMRFIERPHLVDGKEATVLEETVSLQYLADDLGIELRPLDNGQVMALSDNAGTAMLLVVLETFKKPLFAILYTLFVLAAAFHAFNGLWTFLITWGALLSFKSQRAMIPVTAVGMGLLLFLGLTSIWGSFFFGGV